MPSFFDRYWPIFDIESKKKASFKNNGFVELKTII